MLAQYDSAMAALATALKSTQVDVVLKSRDDLDHVKLHAKRVRDRQLLADATEFQMRVERWLGVLLARATEAGQLAGKGRPKALAETVGGLKPATLEEIGVDRKLSMRARATAELEDAAFDEIIAGMRSRMASGKAIIVDPVDQAAKFATVEKRRADHAARTVGGGKVEDLGRLVREGRKFKSIGSDPQWKFLTRSALGDGRSANVHYRTEEVDKIKNLPVGELLDDDGAFYMWMVDWCPQDALDLLAHYGLRHVTTAFTWVKQNPSGEGWHMGQGYWTRCLSGDARVFVSDRKGRVRRVAIRELISPAMVGWSIQTHRGWRRILGATRNEKTETFRINTPLGALECSRNHHWAVKLPQPTRIEWASVDEIKAEKAGARRNGVNLLMPAAPMEPQIPLAVHHGIVLTADIAWLIGLFIAEGNFGTGSHANQIRFSLHNEERHIFDRITAIVDALGIPADRYAGNVSAKVFKSSKKKSAAVYFSSAGIKALIDAFVSGRGALGKRFNLDLLWQTSSEFRQALCIGILDGDGTKLKAGYEGWKGFQNLRLANAGLIEDFRAVMTSIGVPTRPRSHQTHWKNDTLCHSYGVHLSSPKMKGLGFDGVEMSPIEVISIEPSGKQDTFDISVQGESFVVEGVVSHNSNPEQCWLATKGNPKRLYADVRQLIIAPVMEHSRKPDAWLERIERLTAGPYLELQARRTRAGWTSWGDELEFTGVAA